MRLSEIINDCEDLARVMEKIDKYINKIEKENSELIIENERLEDIIGRSKYE